MVVATATACALLLVLSALFIWEKIDIQRQAPKRRKNENAWGRSCSSNFRIKNPKDAVNEALRDWINNPVTTHYVIGSVVGPHPFPDLVARFQSTISKKLKNS